MRDLVAEGCSNLDRVDAGPACLLLFNPSRLLDLVNISRPRRAEARHLHPENGNGMIARPR